MHLDGHRKRCQLLLARVQKCSSWSLTGCSDQEVCWMSRTNEPIHPFHWWARRALYQPELLKPVLPQAVPSPGISSKEKGDRKPRGPTHTVKAKSLQTSLQTLHKYQEYIKYLFQPEKASMLSAGFSGSYGVSADEKKKKRVIQFWWEPPPAILIAIELYMETSL